jgi:DNA-binding MarR family transcriptional regulator
VTAAQDTPKWTDIVALMRRDVRELGRDPAHAARFLQRCTSTTEALTSQLRRGWGLNPHEMQAISTLWEFGRMTMTDLGRRIPLSRAAVTTLTDRLEGSGLVRRIPDPNDRRRVLLEVTERAESEMTRISSHWTARVEEYVRSLDEATWRAAVDVLADLREMAREEAEELRALSSEDLRELGGGAGEVVRRRAQEQQDWW